MEPTGIKFVCECKNGEINTWHDVFEKPIEDIINEMKSIKNWVGGKFLEIYLEFNNDGKYYKIQVDLSNTPYNNLL